MTKMTNWTESIISARWCDLAEFHAPGEAEGRSVYVLLGQDEGAAGDARGHIREASTVSSRPSTHVKRTPSSTQTAAEKETND